MAAKALAEQQEKLDAQINGYKHLRGQLEKAAATFEEEKLTFDFQKVLCHGCIQLAYPSSTWTRQILSSKIGGLSLHTIQGVLKPAIPVLKLLGRRTDSLWHATFWIRYT